MKSNNTIKIISLFVSIIILLSLSGCQKIHEENSYYSSDTIISFPEVTEDDTSNEVLSINGENVSSTDESPTSNITTSSNNIKQVTDNTVSQPVESTSSVSSSRPDIPSVEHKDNPNLTPLTDAEIKEAEDYFFWLVNEERARVGVGPLTRNSTLDKAAKIRVEETFVKMGHTRPDGTDYFTVLDELKYGTPIENTWSEDGENWHTDIIYDCGGTGENVVLTGGSTRQTTKELVDNCFNGFRNSTGHYANMIGKSFSKTGVAVSSEIKDGVLHCHLLQIFTEK